MRSLPSQTTQACGSQALPTVEAGWAARQQCHHGQDQRLCALHKPSSAGWERRHQAVSAPPELPCPKHLPMAFPMATASCSLPGLQRAQLRRGQSASQAVISSVFNSPLHLHCTGPKHYWRGRTRPVSTDPSTWNQPRACLAVLRACLAVLKDQKRKIPFYSQQSLPDLSPCVKCQYKNN